jgi:molecular chaperone IbpA
MTRNNTHPIFGASRLIGFDQVTKMVEQLTKESTEGYPPYNIEKIGERSYTVSMALAGFTESDLEIKIENEQLVIQGTPEEDKEERTYLHKGIAKRNFIRKFQMAPNVTVQSAEFKNGMLEIVLEREIPESQKPKIIPIT